ncbi:MAG: polysaccharide deacetylase family protein [Bradyrhizobium sp.]|nr:polysaccharide deacetylase family protein [Bradyrhizobium sp.]
MRTRWSAIKARASNRLARHLYATPMVLSGEAPMVSFTFDDIPDSAARAGAPMIEEHGGRATFYVSGGLLNQWSGQWAAAGADDIIRLHGKGHEIACHTFSHRRTTDLDADTMAEEIELNRRFFEGLDSSIRLENFAHPYGYASVARKRQLAGTFRSARAVLPGINSGSIDLHFLRAMPLINAHIDASGIDGAFDKALGCGGWLIFYGHDVAAKPSPYGCTPRLLRHALAAATRRKLPIVTVAEALRRVGA